MTYQNGAKFYQVGWVRILINLGYQLMTLQQKLVSVGENLFGTTNIWV